VKWIGSSPIWSHLIRFDVMRRSHACACSAHEPLPVWLAFIDSSSTSSARALAISALDGLENPHAVEIAFAALGAADIETIVAALNVLRSWVPREAGTRLLAAITAIAVDRARDARVRVAAPRRTVRSA
jgi:hypothetical protein